jgi:hypothetical protein
MKINTKIILAIAGLMTSSVLGNTAKAQKVLTAYELYDYSQGNEAAFDARYTGKTFKIKGMVVGSVFKSTERWNSGSYSVWLGSGKYTHSNRNNKYYLIPLSESNYVRLFFTGSNAQQFANIQEGDEITIQGRCIGRGGSLVLEYRFGGRPEAPYMDNCTLIHRELGAKIAKKILDAEDREREAKKKAEEEKQRQKEAQERERLEAVRLQYEAEYEAEEEERRVRAAAEERRRQAEAAERERERKEAEAAAAIEAAIESYYQSHFFIVSSKITGSSSTRDEDKEKNGGKSVKSTYAGFTLGFAVSSIGIYVSPQLEVWLDQNDRTLSNQEKAERKNLPRRRVGLNNGIYTVGGIVGERSFHLYLGGGIHLREDELADLKVRRSYIIEGGCRIPFGSCFTFDLGLGYSGHRQANFHTGLGLIF